MNWALWLTPIVGALIGWFTNYLAVIMIFKPQKPLRTPVFGLTMQGIVPKRKKEIAYSLGVIVERELVSLEGLADQLPTGFIGETLIEGVAWQINKKVATSLPNLLPAKVKILAGNLAEGIVRSQGPALINRFSHQAINELKDKISISRLIEEKINNMDWDSLEHLVREVAAKELKHIEYLGALIGFLIGLFQLILVLSAR